MASLPRARIWRPVDVVPPLAALLLALEALALRNPLPLDAHAVRAWAEIAAVYALLVVAPAAVERRVPGERGRVGGGYALFALFAGFIVATPTVGRPFDPLVVGVVFLAAALLVLARRLKPEFSPLHFLRSWSPFILAGLAYGNLGSIMPAPWRIFDEPLGRADLAFFGEHPSLSLERLAGGFWNDWFSFHYALYIAYPIVIGMAFFALDRRELFERMFLRIASSLWLGNLFYLLFPTAGPRFQLAALYRGPLTGGLLTRMQDDLVGGYGYHFDCFPSLHTAVSLLAVFSLRKTFPRAFVVALFFETNLLVSTVWLRMHWVADVLAGVFLAVLVHALAGAIERATQPDA